MWVERIERSFPVPLGLGITHPPPDTDPSMYSKRRWEAVGAKWKHERKDMFRIYQTARDDPLLDDPVPSVQVYAVPVRVLVPDFPVSCPSTPCQYACSPRFPSAQ